MTQILSTSIEFLSGVGPKRAKILKEEFGIESFYELLTYFPFRYEDRSRVYSVSEVNENLPYVQLRGRIVSVQELGSKRQKRLHAVFRDGTGAIDLVWFRAVSWARKFLREGEDYFLYGKPTVYNGRLNIVHPEIELLQTSLKIKKGELRAVYPGTEKAKAAGVDSKAFVRMQLALQEKLPLRMEETLPAYLIDMYKLIGIRTAFRQIHFPDNADLLHKAQFRLKFEELLYMQLRLAIKKQLRMTKYRGIIFENIGENFNSLYKKLPFELTSAQKRVLKEIRRDCKSGSQMNRLLQGDVGSGKTLVALLSMLMAIDNGYQAVIMAPTEILAQQHYAAFSTFLEGVDIVPAILSGSTRATERKEILQNLESGEIQLMVGTHALLEDRVKFMNLGFAVIDEQHRFGVEQRSRLWRKGDDVLPHVLVMTATPIPRTLAMTVYGDLDVSVIDELPPGRKPVETFHFRDSEKNRFKLREFLKKEISAGRQVYIVYPLIEESEKLDYLNLMQGYEAVVRDFPTPEYKVSIVHGKMKSEDKDIEMQSFKQGKTQIMVATTVIEVGVDVPNASVMIVESAERFGLSQLHQLRGRVGRGSEKSYCILVTGNELSKEAVQRIQTLVKSSDGFEVAETDLRLRGPGDIEGTRQSGDLELKISDIIKDSKILELARSTALQIVKNDPGLLLSENQILLERLNQLNKARVNWSVIS